MQENDKRTPVQPLPDEALSQVDGGILESPDASRFIVRNKFIVRKQDKQGRTLPPEPDFIRDAKE
ncbi:MAG: hypothetical protein PHC80_04585 [Eubacteriales bacterium]|nr:hypothetical protein [Eubacteriales bacterium]